MISRERSRQCGAYITIYTRRKRRNDVDRLHQKRVTFDGKSEQRSVKGLDIKGCLGENSLFRPVERG